MDDCNDQEVKRPSSVTLFLMQNGSVIDSRTLTAGNNWAYNFGNQDYYDYDNSSPYTISELPIPAYVQTRNVYNITFTHNGVFVNNEMVPLVCNYGLYKIKKRISFDILFFTNNISWSMFNFHICFTNIFSKYTNTN